MATNRLNRLRALRLERGLSQTELARRTGIGRPGLWRIETGRARPTKASRSLIAAALELDEARIFPEQGGEA
jgi:transcriptional regulator with XRE-family HTH domain